MPSMPPFGARFRNEAEFKAAILKAVDYLVSNPTLPVDVSTFAAILRVDDPGAWLEPIFENAVRPLVEKQREEREANRLALAPQLIVNNEMQRRYMELLSADSTWANLQRSEDVQFQFKGLPIQFILPTKYARLDSVTVPKPVVLGGPRAYFED